MLLLLFFFEGVPETSHIVIARGAITPLVSSTDVEFVFFRARRLLRHFQCQGLPWLGFLEVHARVYFSVAFTALKKELFACDLICEVSSVRGFTAVAVTGNALPTQTTERHVTG